MRHLDTQAAGNTSHLAFHCRFSKISAKSIWSVTQIWPRLKIQILNFVALFDFDTNKVGFSEELRTGRIDTWTLGNCYRIGRTCRRHDSSEEGHKWLRVAHSVCRFLSNEVDPSFWLSWYSAFLVQFMQIGDLKTKDTEAELPKISNPSCLNW